MGDRCHALVGGVKRVELSTAGASCGVGDVGPGHDLPLGRGGLVGREAGGIGAHELAGRRIKGLAAARRGGLILAPIAAADGLSRKVDLRSVGAADLRDAVARRFGGAELRDLDRGRVACRDRHSLKNGEDG
jgi:hypothetical protein